MKFHLYKDAQKQYRWRLKSNNGKIIADSSEGYSSKQSCEHGIELMKQDVKAAPIVDESAE